MKIVNIIKSLYTVPFELFKKYYYPIIITLGILLFFTFWHLLQLQKVVDSFELKLFDYRTQIYIQACGKEPDEDIVLLLHNDLSNAEISNYPEIGLSRWPYPRNKWREVFQFLRRAPNKISVFDVKFTSSEWEKWKDEVLNREILTSNNVILAFIAQNFMRNKIEAIREQKRQKGETLQLNKEIYFVMVSIMQQSLKKSPYENLYLEKFVEIPSEKVQLLGLDQLINSTFFVAQGILDKFLKSTNDIGIINIFHDESITEVTRGNRPLWKYGSTNKFAQSLGLAATRQVTVLPENKRLSFEKGLFSTHLTIGKKKFALNNYGEILLNWRKNNKIGSFWKVAPQAYTIYPLSRVFIYEKFETIDPFTGYYILPEEENCSWQSHYNDLILNSVADVNYKFLDSYYLQYFINYDFETSYDFITNTKLFFKALYSFITNRNFERPSSLMYLYSRISTGASPFGRGYQDNLYNMIYEDYDYSFINVLHEYQYHNNNYNYNYNKVTTNNPYYNYKNPGYYYVHNLPVYSDKVKGINLVDDEQYNIKNLDKFFDIALNPFYLINKIVILGESTATGDTHSTPVNKVYPGPEIVATSLDNYLNDGTFDSTLIARAPWWIDVLITLVFVVMIVWIILNSSNLFSTASFIILSLATFEILNILLFCLPYFRLWTNMLYPSMFIILASVIAIGYKNVVIDKDKRQIKGLFGKFVSPQILDAVLDDPELLSSNIPRKKEMTVMFSDIRDFTSKSETSDPAELILQLNEYLTEMVEVIIMDYNGTLDKYMGDAVMAFWGDPVPLEDHAKKAVLAGLAMRRHLELLNEKWKKEGKPELRIGIGINSGEMIVGHMGSPRLIDYTVLGDNVNVASRVEGLNKQYGTDIIITESTYELVKDIVAVQELGETRVKGRTKPVKIYTIVKILDDADVNFDPNPTLFVEQDN